MSDFQGERAMRMDLLKAVQQLLRILAAAASVIETVRGVIGDPNRGARAGDAQLRDVVARLPLGGAPPAPTHHPGGPAPPAPPPGQPPAPPPMPSASELRPGEVITR